MNLMLAPLSVVLSFLVVIFSLASRCFSVCCVLVAHILTVTLIRINNDKFTNFIFNVLSFGELSGFINKETQENKNEKKIQ